VLEILVPEKVRGGIRCNVSCGRGEKEKGGGGKGG